MPWRDPADEVSVAAVKFDELAYKMERLAQFFWDEHQAFILVPVLRYIRGDTLSARAHRVLAAASSMPSLETDQATHCKGQP